MTEQNKKFGSAFKVEGYESELQTTFIRIFMVLCFIAIVLLIYGMVLLKQAIPEPVNEPAPAVTVELFDPCTLQDVYCEGEPVPVVGIASYLNYQLPDTCAARDWPRGSKLLVRAGDRSITCVVRDFGPAKALHPDRIVDLDQRQFSQLGSTRTGLVEVTILPL